jgi:spore maturation protein CgeB
MTRLLVVGNPDPVHVGAHFEKAAADMSLPTRLCDVRDAFAAPAWRRRVNWWTRGHRPSRLAEFSAAVLVAAAEHQADVVLATGLAPIDAPTLEKLGERGVLRVNFLTDDPWNPVHQAPWFLAALPRYDWVFSPRYANLSQIRALGPQVEFLPFAYAPEVHFPDPPQTDEERARFKADVMLAGGADADRVALADGLISAGIDIALYGGYWPHYDATRPYARGFLDAGELRRATAGASVCLCIVRRANRDGHSMRSFEAPAMGGCILAEDTEDHHRFFGREGESVLYFSTVEEAAAKTRRLLGDAGRRRALAASVHQRIVSGDNTYFDRLQAMLEACGKSTREDRHRRPRPLSRV